VFFGTGVQLFCMCFATLTFALLGLLSPANRGSLITAFILLFVFMGSFAGESFMRIQCSLCLCVHDPLTIGYYSSMTYKMFRGIQWKQNTLMTAFLYPGIVFSILFVLNLVLWIEGAGTNCTH
jgi:transmembrane 9 superfamily protein 2/4